MMSGNAPEPIEDSGTGGIESSNAIIDVGDNQKTKAC